MADQTTKVTVTFTQQQMELLERLKNEGTFGSDYPEVIKTIFRESIRQKFGKGGVI